MAEALLQKSPNVMWVVVIMSLFAGVVSAFVDNVATVLMIAPVGLAIAKKLDISPVAMIISIAVSSNLQGAATLVGDIAASIMLGGYANMDSNDFFFMDGKPSIFFAVELGALATVPVIMFLFRDQREGFSCRRPYGGYRRLLSHRTAVCQCAAADSGFVLEGTALHYQWCDLPRAVGDRN